MEYRPIALRKLLEVEAVVSVHYFQFARGYVFPGEKHDFWELVYLDKGTVELGADDRRFVLGQSEIAFHEPNEFHSIWAGADKPPDIVVISFVCRSPAMARFRQARLPASDEAKALLATIVREARQAFADDPTEQYLALRRRNDGLAGAEQLIECALSSLLILLLRQMETAAPAGEDCAPRDIRPKSPTGRQEYQRGVLTQMEHYLQQNLQEHITLPELARQFRMSQSALKQLVRGLRQCGVTDWIGALRHENAKRLIREGYLNMTEIAAHCGYSSVHYFSRRFTLREGKTPTEYARSVQRLAE